MPQIRLGYPPTDREELWWVVQALFGVKIPRTRVCPDHCSPFDAFGDAYFRENTVDCSGQQLEVREPNRMSRAIWHASRGLAGKSKTLSTLGLTESYLIGTDITILGGSLAQSNNVHEYMVKAMEFPALPLEMVMDQTATKIQLANKGRVRPLPASQRNVRGPHPSMLLMDEVDEMDLPIYDAALGQPMPQDNYLLRRIPTMTVISSTWQNPDGCVVLHTPIVTRRGLIPVQDVRIGDEVPTRSGWRLVVAAIDTGKQETVTVELASGRRLTCTPWHPVWVEGAGFIRADSLAPGSHVVTVVMGISSPGLGEATGPTSGHADPADALLAPAAGTDDDGVLVQVMPVVADLLGLAHGKDTLVVDRRGYQLEMAQAYAGPARASSALDVIEDLTLRDRSVDLDPDPAMGEPDALAARVEGPVALDAVAVLHDSERPEDALVGVQVDDYVFAQDEVVNIHHHGMVLPTYDLTVEGCHEYVAEGVLVHNTLTEIFRRNEEKAKPSPIYRWCYKENLDTNNPSDDVTGAPEGWLTQETIDEKIDEVSAEMFRVEYDLGEPAIGNRAFTTDLVDKVFCWNVEPEVLEESKDYSRYRFERRVRNGVYVVGADWAKENDYTVMYVIRMMGDAKRRLVYYVRVNRRPYPLMIGWFNTLLKEYQVSTNGAWHDSTGLGDVIDDYVDMRARPFTMTGDKRAIMLNNYVNAIEKGTWEFPVALKRPGVMSRPYTEMKYCVGIGSLVRTFDGDKPIEQVKVGDRVLTRQGWRAVEAVMDNGVRDVVRLRASDGKEVLLTPDHSVATGRGWVEAQSLQQGDVLHVVLADPAGPAAVLGDDQIMAGVGVAVGAMGLAGAAGSNTVSSQDVLALGDRLQMVGTYASSAGAAAGLDVVEHSPIGYGPDKDLVGESVSHATAADVAVALVVNAAGPDPAIADDLDPGEDVCLVAGDLSAGPTTGGTAPGVSSPCGLTAIGTGVHVMDVTPAGLTRVFDISVSGVHEFTVNGIVVHNCRVGDLYRTSQTEEKYHLPDTVCAGGLAEHAARRMAGIVDLPQLERGDEAGTLQAQFTNDGEPEQGLVSTMDAPHIPIANDREISFLV